MNAELAVSSSRDLASEFSLRGFQLFHLVLAEAECDSLSGELTHLFESQQKVSRTKIGGVRNLLRLNARVAQLATSPRLRSLVERVTDRPAFPVRAICFDKTVESNWRVPWHQDLTIAVAQRIETTGFGPWSVKEGVAHVQPPLEILKAMVAVRIHLDDCDGGNGALRVISGSHLKGELDADQIGTLASSGQAVVCELTRGGALIMRPLLLHASSPATSPSHRRVLHIEYACNELPNGLQWYDR